MAEDADEYDEDTEEYDDDPDEMYEDREESEKDRKKLNREIRVIVCFFLLLFGGFFAYFIYFVNVGSDSYVTSPYNKRHTILAESIVRGDILGSGGEVLASTSVGEDGTETRTYPYGRLFSHAVGYASNGRSGIEANFNYYLLDSHDNLAERIRKDLQDEKNIGDSVVTTLDVALQQVAAQAMGGYRGAVIAIEPSTGRVLAMVSAPDFDPNTIESDWETLTEDPNGEARLLNRATQGKYPPGSTFKIVTLTAYLREHGMGSVLAYQYDCYGSYSDGNVSIPCFNGHEHGHETLENAFANSCNAAFCDIGMAVDPAFFRKTAESLFFNQTFDFSLATSSGTFTLDENSDSWAIMQTAIGQGETLVTPLQMALITCGIANGGVVRTPYIVDHIVNASGDLVKSFSATDLADAFSEEEASVLNRMMCEVVNAGTGHVLQTDAYQAAAKTGTAQYQTGADSSHAWVTAFAPADDPRIVVTVILEDGGTGSGTATGVARQILDAYLLR